ncbi:MAG: hypothetical protein ABSA21_01060 [Candidatus Limnocylindrales bacterium]|jgi:hypothetical protein
MSGPRVEPGLDDQPQSDPARRPDPERVIPSAARAGSGVRSRPHGGLREQGPAGPVAAPSPTPYPPKRRAQPWQPPQIGLPAFHRPAFHRPAFHRLSWPLSIRQTISVAVGLATVVAVVAGLVLIIPSHPVAPPATGSFRGVDFRAASKTPTGNFYYGPDFVAQGDQLLMMGSDGNTSTVWESTDGSTWQQISDPGSFGAPGQRFVVLGFADDGNGGLSAVGSGFAPGAKVVATAWHSRDGRTWSPAAVDFPTNVQMIGLASRPGALISAGNGVAWYSADGTSWTLEALPNATGYMPRAVRVWAGGFEIVAVSSGTAPRDTKAWVSTDGKTWTEAAAPMVGFQAQDLVAYGNGLVAVGSQILTPAELATPTPSPTPTPTPAPTGSGKPKATPKPTVKPKATASPLAAASPTASATPLPEVAVATSWISPDGVHWFRGSTPIGYGSQSMDSVTQVSDSLVAVGSEPGGLPGGSASPSGTLALWTSDDGLTWKPVKTDAPALTRGRLTQFGRQLVLAGVESSGSLDVMTGAVALGSPLPLIVPTPTPAFTLAFHAGATPMVSGLKAADTLGPVLAAGNQFLVFVNSDAGTSVWSSPDGRAWTQQADPSVFTASEPNGVPAVSAAIPDGQGGAIAVGRVVGTDSSSAAIWSMSGSSWTPATISVSGGAPSSLGSVAVYQGSYVAAANSADGPRILFSDDGQNWGQAAVSGATGYMLTVSSWSGGFVATGANPDGSGNVGVWTSVDGLSWVSQASWKLPPNAGNVYGARKGLVTTTTGLTTATSWWWSADGKAWQDARLSTTGGCWSAVDSGFIAVSAPAAGSPDTGWHVWASKDASSWQQPGGTAPSFGVATTCGVASIGSRVIVVGWSKPGILQDFYGDLTGL